VPEPPLIHIDTAADELVEAAVERGPASDAVLHLSGRMSAGKTSCLALVAERLLEAEPTAIPVMLSPPARQLDTGPAALMDFCVGLSSRVSLNGALIAWAESARPWRQRVLDVRRWIEAHSERLVLLCDEPTYWGAGSEETFFFSDRALDATRVLVEQARCRRIVAGRVPDSMSPDRVVRIQPVAPDTRWLADAEAWGELAAAAAALGDSETPLDGLTPLEIRLLVALSAIRGVARGTAGFETGQRQHQIARRLWNVVSRDPALVRLKRAWLRLSFVRRPFELDLLETVGAAELSRRDRAVLQHCLLFGDDELRAHEIIRTEARTWLREQPYQSRQQVERHAARTLARHYVRKFAEAASNDDPAAVTESMEAFHFVSVSGDMDLRASVPPYFSEQLDALGWSLSYLHARYEDAADVFREAIAWDETDDYAHHYLAFNLDVQGKSPEIVEEEYRRAVDLNPANSWWHARYIAFLVHRGRIEDARAQWDQAQVALGVAERHSDRFLFETLHLWVAEALLDRAELSFAGEVLDEVPDWARRGDVLPAYPRLRKRLSALQEAADLGAFVPAHRLRHGWWREGPELLQESLGEDDDRRLVRWLAARVESIDQDGIHVAAANLEPFQDSPPTTGRMTIADETFRRLCRDSARAQRLQPGWHMEIGVYASHTRPQDAATTIIRLHEPRAPEWSGESFLDTSRYLRRVLSTR
jgi:tetratricopeptide (TPR) repeat protein